MEYIEINVPNMNDSMSRIVLNGTEYQIRFTYNDTADSWSFGLYTHLQEPIICGVKIVPRFPIGLSYIAKAVPTGFFVVQSKKDRIGRNDFENGSAKFRFYPVIFEE